MNQEATGAQLNPPTAGAAGLGPLTQTQLYERIAARLVDWIASGRLQEGDRLPPERELALQLQVSRSSIREAIGALKVDGILETRPGAGSFVTAGALEQARALVAQAPDTAPVSADASPFSLLQAREALEPGIARAAAERAARSPRVEELLKVMESIDVGDPAQRDRWSDADRLFHRELAVISENPVLLLLAEQIAAMMDQPLWRRLRDDLISIPSRTTIHAAEHRLIFQSIVEGEVEQASAQALHHVQRVRRQMNG